MSGTARALAACASCSPLPQPPLRYRPPRCRCLPQFLLAENSWRKTNHSIIFGFFFVSSSLFTLLGGEVTTLSGVYSLSFLGVMGLFAFACMLLKYKRPGLPRSVRTRCVPPRAPPRPLAHCGAPLAAGRAR